MTNILLPVCPLVYLHPVVPLHPIVHFGMSGRRKSFEFGLIWPVQAGGALLRIVDWSSLSIPRQPYVRHVSREVDNGSIFHPPRGPSGTAAVDRQPPKFLHAEWFRVVSRASGESVALLLCAAVGGGGGGSAARRCRSPPTSVLPSSYPPMTRPRDHRRASNVLKDGARAGQHKKWFGAW